MKAFLKLLAGLALFAYLVLAVTRLNRPRGGERCQRVAVTVKDSARSAFVTEAEVRRLLSLRKMDPEGALLDSVDLLAIEQALEEHPFILDAECYRTSDAVLHIDLSQRLPVMRILADNGANYFIDAEGQRLAKAHYAADVAVATGHISERYAQQCLAPIGRYLQRHDFWNDQVEQFHVLRDGSIEMVPRVGSHIVYLGAPKKIDKKLANLKLLYDQVLSEVGWNKYSRIDLQYMNQIICTKKDYNEK